MKKKMCGADIVLAIVKYVFVIGFTLLCFYPFYYVVIGSLSDPQKFAKGVYLLPTGFTLSTYMEFFKRDDLWRAYFISTARTVAGTVISLLCTSSLAFLMTRKEMIGRKIVYRYVIITMYLNAGLIPWYLIMKSYHLQNSFLLYIIPSAIGVYNMILIKTFMEQLPESLEESAMVEGATIWDVFFKIVLPLSKPILATIAVFCAVNQWNSWQDNFFLVSDPNLKTLQLILRDYLNEASRIAQAMEEGNTSAALAEKATKITSKSVKMVSIVVTMLPVTLVYPFAQKYFTKGIMMGAVKG